jgi:predicted nucleotidyltransferase
LISFEKTLRHIDEFCNINSIKYAVIGGVAVITHGYYRTTKDLDITILCRLEDMNEIHNKFIKEFSPVYDDSLNFFIKNFVLPLRDKTTGVKIYVAAGLTIFDDTIIARRKIAKLGEVEFYICSLEDLIIYKLFANRYLDLGDVEKLLQNNKDSIDRNYIFETAEKFRELEREDILENLHKFLKK